VFFFLKGLPNVLLSAKIAGSICKALHLSSYQREDDIEKHALINKVESLGCLWTRGGELDGDFVPRT
jgi:hypothetical protein